MKAFFEEYGLVLVVTVIAVGMISFSDEFKTTLSESITGQWTHITSTTGNGG